MAPRAYPLLLAPRVCRPCPCRWARGGCRARGVRGRGPGSLCCSGGLAAAYWRKGTASVRNQPESVALSASVTNQPRECCEPSRECYESAREYYESASVTKQPASVTKQPASVTNQPASVTNQPASVTNPPASVTNPPSSEPLHQDGMKRQEERAMHARPKFSPQTMRAIRGVRMDPPPLVRKITFFEGGGP